ncbi:hypothetical protein [Neobacillus sp. SAB-20_R2A]
MWIITVFLGKNNVSMYEFYSEQEAREAFGNVAGCKFLSEVIYYNDKE